MKTPSVDERKNTRISNDLLQMLLTRIFLPLFGRSFPAVVEELESEVRPLVRHVRTLFSATRRFLPRHLLCSTLLHLQPSVLPNYADLRSGLRCK